MMLIALALLLPVPPSDSTLAVRYVPQVGQHAHVALEKVRAEYAGRGEDAVLVERVAGEWTIRTGTVREGLNGYELTWYYQRGALLPAVAPIPAASPGVDPVTGTVSEVPIRFTVDANGQVRDLLEVAEVRGVVHRTLRGARERADPQDHPRLETLARQAQTDGGLRALLLSDAERYHLPLGRTLPVNGALETQATLRNPFGEGPIPATETLRLDSLAADGRLAYVTWSLTPDAATLGRIVHDLLEGFAPGAIELTPDELARRFHVREEARFEVEPASGVVHLASFERRIRTGDRGRVETTIFRLIHPDD